jgi:hypothetical protein
MVKRFLIRKLVENISQGYRALFDVRAPLNTLDFELFCIF